jgi:hypothetical protein
MLQQSGGISASVPQYAYGERLKQCGKTNSRYPPPGELFARVLLAGDDHMSLVRPSYVNSPTADELQSQAATSSSEPSVAAALEDKDV